jgi:hypothetical protein
MDEIVGWLLIFRNSRLIASRGDLFGGRLNRCFPSIRANTIRSHLEFLVDDALEGRHTGSRGFDVAARYVRAQFTAFGLKSGVADGSYFQSVPLRQTEVDVSRTSLVISSEKSKRQLAYNRGAPTS